MGAVISIIFKVFFLVLIIQGIRFFLKIRASFKAVKAEQERVLREQSQRFNQAQSQNMNQKRFDDGDVIIGEAEKVD